MEAGPGGQSEAWDFTVMPDSVLRIIESSPFIRIEEKMTAPAIMHQRFLKIAYTNNGADKAVTLSVRPLRGGSRKHTGFKTEQSVHTGQNFILINLNGKMKLEEGVVYEVEINDHGKQPLRLQFQTFNYF
ncbi:MAG: hypothetical protein NVV59_08925 [Chitinophagaceae bacterium]|nr:hypothetical protein [Chitinophagaceae bacterium]